MKILSLFLALIFVGCADNSAPVGQAHVRLAVMQIDSKEYIKAMQTLESVYEHSEYYDSAQLLLRIADSLNSIAVLERAEREKKEKAELNLDLCNSVLADLRDGYDFSIYYGNKEQLIEGIDQLTAWWKIALEGHNSEFEENEKAGTELGKMLESIQKREMPNFRKAYGSIMDRVLWENDIDVKTSGRDHSTVTFIGGLFAANRNIKDFHQAALPLLKDMRFDQVRYKWYDSQRDYQYYSLDPFPDQEPFISL